MPFIFIAACALVGVLIAVVYKMRGADAAALSRMSRISFWLFLGCVGVLVVLFLLPLILMPFLK